MTVPESAELLLRKLPFQRLVHELTQEFLMDIRWQAVAILAIQEAGEAHIVNQMELANLSVIHSKCQTIRPKGLWLVCRIMNLEAKEK